MFTALTLSAALLRGASAFQHAPSASMAHRVARSVQRGATTMSGETLSATLEDTTVNLSPYFKLKDAAKFKEIWKGAYGGVEAEAFANKADCSHYAFTFTADGKAHCREAYYDAAGVLQHLADVDAELKAVLDGPAELESLMVSGPKEEIDKLREPLGAFGCKFYVAEWGFRPSAPAMQVDTAVHLYPFFELKDEAKFKQIWSDAYGATKAAAVEESTVQYAFAFDSDGDATIAQCREAYANGEGVLTHLGNVDAPLKAALDPEISKLVKLELHGPKAELDKCRDALAPLGCEFYETEWGFRNAVN